MTESDNGGRPYERDDVRERYLAHRHSGSRSPNVIMEEPAFVAALGSLAGARVADLGCGDGSTAPLLFSHGAAHYVGLDASAAMVGLARAQHGSPTAEFLQQPMETLALEASRYDLVVSRMALHYVARVEPVIAHVHRALRPGGRLLFSVSHPVITAYDATSADRRTNWVVDDYFNRGPRERDWFGDVAIWHHRTVEDYVRAVLEAGFMLEHLSECEPLASALSGQPDELDRRRRVPLILMLAARRT